MLHFSRQPSHVRQVINVTMHVPYNVRNEYMKNKSIVPWQKSTEISIRVAAVYFGKRKSLWQVMTHTVFLPSLITNSSSAPDVSVTSTEAAASCGDEDEGRSLCVLLTPGSSHAAWTGEAYKDETNKTIAICIRTARVNKYQELTSRQIWDWDMYCSPVGVTDIDPFCRFTPNWTIISLKKSNALFTTKRTVCRSRLYEANN